MHRNAVWKVPGEEVTQYDWSTERADELEAALTACSTAKTLEEVARNTSKDASSRLRRRSLRWPSFRRRDKSPARRQHAYDPAFELDPRGIGRLQRRKIHETSQSSCLIRFPNVQDAVLGIVVVGLGHIRRPQRRRVDLDTDMFALVAAVAEVQAIEGPPCDILARAQVGEEV